MSDVVEHKDPMRTFQDKVVEKVRMDIGEMLPDDALAKLVQRAVDEQFFKDRVVNDGSFHKKTGPSWFVQEVAKVADPIIKEHVEKYVADNADTIEEAVKMYLSDANLTLIAVAAMQAHTHQQIFEAANQIVQQIRTGY